MSTATAIPAGCEATLDASMDVAAYLDRIGLPPERAGAEPSLDLLADLQYAHVTSVPFENLDIARGVPIELAREAFHAKVVDRERGGFCYELNGLFEALLAELGFETTVVSGRVAREDGSLGPPFDHLAVLVDLDGHDRRFLADVGFGDFARRPLPLDGSVRGDASGEYRVVRDAEAGTDAGPDAAAVRAESRDDADDPWTTEYEFTAEPRALTEFAAMCEYHQTAEESPFTDGAFVTMATPSGRVTLSPDSLTVTDGGGKRAYPVASNDEWERVLAERFGIVL